VPRRVTAVAEPRWQRRPDDRPQALMASALKLVAEHGYSRVRLEDIAADAGVSKATVYHYFSNRDDLITRAVAEKMAERHADIQQAVKDAGGSAETRLAAFLKAMWESALTPYAGMWQRLLVSELVTEAPQIFALWARALIERWRLVETLIREGQAAGEFRADADAEVAARLIVSGLSHQALFHVHFDLRRLDPCGVDRIFTSALEQFFQSLHPAPRSRSRASRGR
jgi:AcrR family transcriptional regulator